MGPHERKALIQERIELMKKPRLSQMEGRRLDELDKLLDTRPYPDNLMPRDPGYVPSIDG